MSIIKNKWALITGASEGIGKAIAIKLASEKINIIACARNKKKLEDLKNILIDKYDVSVKIFILDVRVNSDVENFAKELENENITPNFLINNAGLALGLDLIQDGDIEKWDAMIDTNLKGLLYMSRAILPCMIKKAQGGHIINLGSTAGWQTYPGGNVYNATKYAVRGLSDAMSLDLVDTDIKVSCVAPGNCETDFSLVRFDGNKQKADAVYSSYECLKPEDVADLVSYILNSPKHVNIPYVRIMPTAQRSVYIAKKSNKS